MMIYGPCMHVIVCFVVGRVEGEREREGKRGRWIGLISP